MGDSQALNSSLTCCLEEDLGGRLDNLAGPKDSAADVCWVCLEEDLPGHPLVYPCSCPRPVHPPCLARWQLHSAGSKEETICRFCGQCLPDWKTVLKPCCNEAEKEKATPTMSVTFNGMIHHILVKGGPDGYRKFVDDIRTMFGITEELDMHLAFDCADPLSGQLVKLNGSGAFQAAVHCATISAAKRLHSRQLLHLQRPRFQNATSPFAGLR
ncbi:hypothetical protein WJX73_003837 [Symbiochloris irregularis]|uniref:RING-CH-type domain-containing protein n=1 Tax=Symbiochloris irregularis TaxID=706552 RepID=A0AAW1PNI0_9CHLO